VVSVHESLCPQKRPPHDRVIRAPRGCLLESGWSARRCYTTGVMMRTTLLPHAFLAALVRADAFLDPVAA